MPINFIYDKKYPENTMIVTLGVGMDNNKYEKIFKEELKDQGRDGINFPKLGIMFMEDNDNAYLVVPIHGYAAYEKIARERNMKPEDIKFGAQSNQEIFNYLFKVLNKPEISSDTYTISGIIKKYVPANNEWSETKSTVTKDDESVFFSNVTDKVDEKTKKLKNAVADELKTQPVKTKLKGF